jgi:hypothetical protein
MQVKMQFEFKKMKMQLNRRQDARSPHRRDTCAPWQLEGVALSSERQVWFNYRETRLTHQKSYLSGLNYVHQNAVKHGLVPVANQYPWCSARWFERASSPAMAKSIYRFRIDRLQG